MLSSRARKRTGAIPTRSRRRTSGGARTRRRVRVAGTPLLHTHQASHLRRALLRHGGSRLTVIDLPWYLEEQQLPAVPEVA